MYFDVKVDLTPEQLEEVKEQIRTSVTESIKDAGKIEGYIRDVIKAQIRSIVNEEIQTKNYRRYIADKVEKTLLNEGLIDGQRMYEKNRNRYDSENAL